MSHKLYFVKSHVNSVSVGSQKKTKYQFFQEFISRPKIDTKHNVLSKLV